MLPFLACQFHNEIIISVSLDRLFLNQYFSQHFFCPSKNAVSVVFQNSFFHIIVFLLLLFTPFSKRASDAEIIGTQERHLRRFCLLNVRFFFPFQPVWPLLKYIHVCLLMRSISLTCYVLVQIHCRSYISQSDHVLSAAIGNRFANTPSILT